MRLKRASEAALRKSVTPAVLRHTCAARLFCAGGDLITVSAYMGHASPSITAALYLDAPGFPSSLFPRTAPPRIFRVSGPKELLGFLVYRLGPLSSVFYQPAGTDVAEPGVLSVSRV